jgi:hypothetical protein
MVLGSDGMDPTRWASLYSVAVLQGPGAGNELEDSTQTI